MFLQIIWFFVVISLGVNILIASLTLTRIWLAKYAESKKVKPEYDWASQSFHMIAKATKSLKSKKD